MHEQAEEYARQEKILKLISSELTRNTTRVVEQAVKTEVQQSVLPSLESITRAEVKAVLSEQIGSGVVELVNRVTTCPCLLIYVLTFVFLTGFTGRDRENSSPPIDFESLRKFVNSGAVACHRATDQGVAEWCFPTVPRSAQHHFATRDYERVKERNCCHQVGLGKSAERIFEEPRSHNSGSRTHS
jgi:hypothetical protein